MAPCVGPYSDALFLFCTGHHRPSRTLRVGAEFHKKEGSTKNLWRYLGAGDGADCDRVRLGVRVNKNREQDVEGDG